MSRRIALLVAVLGFCILAVFLFRSASREGRLRAWIGDMRGAVSFSSAGEDASRRAEREQLLGPGDTIATTPEGEVLIAFADGSRVRIGRGSRFDLEECRRRRIMIRLGLGVLEAWVTKIAYRRFEVYTPYSRAAVRGTRFRVSVESSGRTLWQVFEGLLEVRDFRGDRTMLPAGEELLVESPPLPWTQRPIPKGERMPLEPRLSPVKRRLKEGSGRRRRDEPRRGKGGWLEPGSRDSKAARPRRAARPRKAADGTASGAPPRGSGREDGRAGHGSRKVSGAAQREDAEERPARRKAKKSRSRKKRRKRAGVAVTAPDVQKAEDLPVGQGSGAPPAGAAPAPQGPPPQKGVSPPPVEDRDRAGASPEGGDVDITDLQAPPPPPIDDFEDLFDDLDLLD